MTAPDHFEQLRRAAHERGMADYDRAVQLSRNDGQPIIKYNPHQNNFATDEREHWNNGWDSAREMDESDMATHPLVRELAAALEPFVKFNCSLEYIRIEVKSEDVKKARDVLARVKKS